MPAAEAQVSVYATAALTAFGFSNDGSPFRYNSDKGAIVGGAFYNFPIKSRLTAGIDGRVLYSPGTDGGISGAGALRVGFVPKRVRLRPYFEIGGGVVSATGPFYDYVEPNRITKGAVEFLGGLDVRLTRSIDLRALEYGAEASTSTSGTGVGNGFLDTGVVYHLQRRAKH